MRALSKQSPCQYGPRHAAYDLKKLRGKQIVRRIGHTRRYEPLPILITKEGRWMTETKLSNPFWLPLKLATQHAGRTTQNRSTPATKPSELQ